MPPFGYPDFSRVSQSVGDPFVANYGGAHVAGEVDGPFYVGIWPAISLQFISFTAATRYRVILDYFFDQAMTQPAGSITYQGAYPYRFNDTVPQLGPWMRVSVDGSAYPATWQILVWPSVVPTLGGFGTDETMVFLQTSVALGAGATLLVDFGRSPPGEAMFYCGAGITNWDCILSTVDYSNTYREIAVFNGAHNANAVVQNIIIPRYHMRANFRNLSAGATNVLGSCQLLT